MTYILLRRNIVKKIMALTVAVMTMAILPTVFAENENNARGTEIPSSFSWCNVDGIDFTTPIKNQEPAPTCEAYALVAAVETLVQYKVGHAFGCDLSEAHLYFYAGGTVAAGGVRLTDAADYLVEYGVPDEGCFPDPHRPYDTNPPIQSLSGWGNRTVKIQEWGWVDNNQDSIKHALIEHGPLVACIVQRPDFLGYRGGIYTPHRWQRIKSGHVITIVGYNDDQQCWIIRNSAGKDWGEDGYVRVAYSANNPYAPFFWPFYGGSGILYIDGVYGNLQPDVPKIHIEFPKRQYTYLFGHELPTLLKKVSFIQKGVPRIFGAITVKANATNTNTVEFYLDGKLQFTDNKPPFEWDLDASSGMHTIETFAYNEKNEPKDIMDIFVLN